MTLFELLKKVDRLFTPLRERRTNFYRSLYKMEGEA
jgi:hypothetical protein